MKNNPGPAGRHRRKADGLKARQLRFEACESRQMLSVTAVWNPTGGVLALTGDSASDKVAVVGQSSYVDIYVAGRFQARLTDANSGNVNTINFAGGTGTDSLTVQNIQPSGSLTIGAAAANFNAVESLSVVNSQNVTINASNGFSFGTSSLTGALTVNAAGALTQTGPLVVAGATTLVAGSGNNITLTNASNNFGSVAITSGNNVSLRDVNSLELGASTISGNLSVQASLSSSTRGTLTDSGPISVTGSTTLAVGSASTITLDNATNNLGASVAITSAGQATLVNPHDTVLGTSSVTGNLTVDTSGAAAGDGAISQPPTARVVVGKIATFTAATGENITLSNAANNFGTLVATANDLAVRDANSLVLGNLSVGGNLSVTTSGALTQTGAITMTGTPTSPTTLNAGAANSITLTKSANTLAGDLRITGRNVAIVNAGGIRFDTSTISGTLTATALGGDITEVVADPGPPAVLAAVLSVAGKATFTAAGQDVLLDNSGNKFSEVAVTNAASATLRDSLGGLALGTSRIATDLTVTTPGPLTQTGVLTVGGNTSLIVTSSDVTLKNSANNFVGSVTVTGARDVSLADLNSLELGDVAARNLTVSVRGGIAQTPSTAVTATGTTTLTAGRASNIALTEDNALTGAISITAAGNATLNNTLATRFGVSSVTSNLTVTSGGGISQSGKLTVGRTADLTANAGAGDITLEDPNNNFYIATVSGAAVSLADVNALLLGSSSSADSLKVVAGKSIGQNGQLTVTGAATFQAGIYDGITLTSDANDFQGAVSLTAGKNVFIRDSGGIEFGASTIGGLFGVTAGGDITDSGKLLIAGKTTLSTTGNVVLDDDGGTVENNFSEVAVTDAVNVTLKDVDALRLGASTISGTLDVETGGPLTQSGALAVSGATATFNANGNDIDLMDEGNNFVEVMLDGQNVSINDMDALNLGLTTVTGNLSVTTYGHITATGSVTVATPTATATFDAGLGGDVDLNGVADDIVDNIATLVIKAGRNVTIDNGTNDLVLGTSDISGDLTIVSATGVTQAGSLTVGETLDVTATTIELNDPGNSYYLVNANGTDVTLVNSNTVGTCLQDLTVTGDLLVDSAGTITSIGSVTVSDTTKTAEFIAEDAGGAQYDIALGLSGTCAISAQVAMHGKDINLDNSVATTLGDCTATENLTVTSAAALTNDLGGGLTGSLNVAGVTRLTANTGSLTLKAVDCVFGGYLGADFDTQDYPGDPEVSLANGALLLSAPTGTVHVEG